MKSQRKLSAIVLGLGILASSLGVVGAAYASSITTYNTCQLLAWTPGHSFASGNAWAQGGRSGCINSAGVTVNLWEEKPWNFDRRLATGTQNGKNVKFTVYGTITSSDRGKRFYTETVSTTGATRESARATFN